MDHHVTGLNNPDAYTVCLGVCFVSLPTKTNPSLAPVGLKFQQFSCNGISL